MSSGETCYPQSESSDVTVIIGLSNPKSPTNVGGVMRAAGCYQADAVRFSGERYPRAASFQTDTKNVVERMPLERVEDLLADLPLDMKIVCVELAEGASPLPEFQHPDSAIYLFGPEDGTLEQSLLDAADAVVYVPTVGCMNLSASVNVVLYDRLAKRNAALDHGEQIRQNRDRNNRVRVRDHKG